VAQRTRQFIVRSCKWLTWLIDEPFNCSLLLSDCQQYSSSASPRMRSTCTVHRFCVQWWNSDRRIKKVRKLRTAASWVKFEVVTSWCSHRPTPALFVTYSALYTLTYKRISPRKIMIYCQKVGRLEPIWAVPPLKVGRLGPSHGDRFRRQWLLAIEPAVNADCIAVDDLGLSCKAMQYAQLP